MVERTVDEVQRLSECLGVKLDEVGLDKEWKVPYLKKDDQSQLKGLGTISTYITSQSNLGPQLLGKNIAEEALINQWLEFRVAHLDRYPNQVELESNLRVLNDYLSNKTYFVSHRLTLADIIIYNGLHPVFKNLSFQEKEGLIHLSRWFDFVQHSSLLKDRLDPIVFSKTRLYLGMTRTH